jgi:hypothetical protein
MKSFLSHHWYKLFMALSAVVFSFGFLVWAMKYNPAKAGTPAKASNENSYQNDVYVVGVGRSFYAVK